VTGASKLQFTVDARSDANENIMSVGDVGSDERKGGSNLRPDLGGGMTKEDQDSERSEHDILTIPAAREAPTFLQKHHRCANGTFQFDLMSRGMVAITFSNDHSWVSDKDLKYVISISYGAKQRAAATSIPALRAVSEVSESKLVAALHDSAAASARVQTCMAQLRAAEAELAQKQTMEAAARTEARVAAARLRSALLQSLDKDAQIRIVQFLSEADVLAWKLTCRNHTSSW
jgi:hypothetical protein